METTFNPAIHSAYSQTAPHQSLWTRFTNYCNGQQHNRLLWLGLALAAHGCVLTPMVVMITLLTGPNFPLFMTAMVAMGIALVTNLAAMPTKVTIPAFALSILIDLAVIACCLVPLASR